MPGINPAERNLERYIDFDVLDRNESKVGDVEAVWEDETGNPAFINVRTGWLGMGRSHVVPAEEVSVNEQGHAMRLPYSKDVIKEAPSYDDQTEIDRRAAEEIYNYYRDHGYKGSQPSSDVRSGEGYGATEDQLTTPSEHQSTDRPRESSSATTEEEQVIPLKEEELHVDKREHTHDVRLRKVVRTEVVNKPVEVEHEELVVERANVDRPSDESIGSEEDVYIPLRREEAVANKETRVREEVRVGKQKHTEHQDIRDEVKKEDVDIDRDDENATRH